MWSVHALSLLLLCYACVSAQKHPVYFDSKNFFNILRWDPLKPTVPGQTVLYSVKYWRDDEGQFRVKKECQNISGLSCDLTAETPSEHHVQYRAKVFVNGSCLYVSTTFTPLRDTKLGSPLVGTSITGSTLNVNVSLPRGPNGASLAEIIRDSKDGSASTVPEYTLKISKPERAAEVFHNKSGIFSIPLKLRGTEYCGSVVYQPDLEWGRNESEPHHFCISVPDDAPISLWPLVSVAVLVAVVITSFACGWYYVKAKGSLKSLELEIPQDTCKVQKNLDKNLILSEVVLAGEIFKPNNVQKLLSLTPSEGYSPQDTPPQRLLYSNDSSADGDAPGPSPRPEDASGHSSGTYGDVTVVIPEPGEGIGGIPPQASGLSPESAFAPPLVLNTVRAVNGQLLLLPFETQCSPEAERKPLLKYLTNFQGEPCSPCLQGSDSSEWTDSGLDESTVATPTNSYCNSCYSHSQSVVSHYREQRCATPSEESVFQSGYKSNWFPVTLHGPPLANSEGYDG